VSVGPAAAQAAPETPRGRSAVGKSFIVNAFHNGIVLPCQLCFLLVADQSAIVNDISVIIGGQEADSTGRPDVRTSGSSAFGPEMLTARSQRRDRRSTVRGLRMGIRTTRSG
jgi:hypothetical protein